MHRLRENGENEGFVTGNDLSSADKLFILMTWALQTAEKLYPRSENGRLRHSAAGKPA
jgi:hypothetical protein